MLIVHGFGADIFALWQHLKELLRNFLSEGFLEVQNYVQIAVYARKTAMELLLQTKNLRPQNVCYA